MIAWLVGGIFIGLGVGVIAGLLYLYYVLKDLWS